jgi:hypothetical protein
VPKNSYNKRNPKKGIESQTFRRSMGRGAFTSYNKRNPKKGIERLDALHLPLTSPTPFVTTKEIPKRELRD